MEGWRVENDMMWETSSNSFLRDFSVLCLSAIVTASEQDLKWSIHSYRWW